MRNIDWSKVQEAGEYAKVTPGGYIVRIVKVEDNEQGEYITVYYDFVEGELKGYYAQLYKAKDFWGGRFVRSYKEKALPFFKAFKTAVERSNPGYTFDNNPQSLVKKYVGVVIGEEEYLGNAGEKKVRTYVDRTVSGQRIREGDFKIPELKRLKPQDDPFTELADTVESIFDNGDPFANLNANNRQNNSDGYIEDDNGVVLPF